MLSAVWLCDVGKNFSSHETGEIYTFLLDMFTPWHGLRKSSVPTWPQTFRTERQSSLFS